MAKPTTVHLNNSVRRWIGAITTASWSHSDTFPRWSTRRHSTAVRRLRISCRHSRIEPSEKPGTVHTVEIGGIPCRIRFDAERSKDKLRNGNVTTVTRVPGQSGSVRLRAWFSVHDIDIRAVELDGCRGGVVDSLAKSIQADGSTVKRIVIKRLLKPFDYPHRLLGVEANKFFGPVGNRHWIRLATVDGSPMLVVSS